MSALRRSPLFRCGIVLATLTLLLVMPPSSGVARQDKHPAASREIAYPAGTAPVVLSTGTGDRSLTVTVDGYGSFGSATPAGNAMFDPAGPTVSSGTVFQSAVFFSPASNYLSTDNMGTALPPVNFTSATTTTAISSFVVAGYHVDLTQTVSRTSNGSILTQTYAIRNTSTSSRNFTCVRFVDGDLGFDGTIADYGAVSPDGRMLYEFDEGDDPQSASTFVGITAEGGEPAGFTIQEFPYSEYILYANGIPASDLNKVLTDANGDGITDSGFDVTLSLATRFIAGPGETVSYTSVTRFGDQTLAPRATLIWDPPVASATDPKPPPEHLRAAPLDARVEPAALAEALTPPSDLTGYSIYTAGSSPVVPSAETFFGTVPPSQTNLNVPTSEGGSFFVVTARYPSGESVPSNETSADVPSATLTSVKVTSIKIVGKGSGFSPSVTVYVDGIPFSSPARVKGSAKVVQKGPLLTGQSIANYMATHSSVLIQFRNNNGGMASYRYAPH